MFIPGPENIGQLLRVASDSFRAYIGLRAFAGLWLGEASAVQVGDTDFLRRTLTVSRQVQRAGRGVEIPKWGGEGDVYLAPTLVDMLAAHVAAHSPGDNPSRWLFADDGRQPQHQNSVTYRWSERLRAAGLLGIQLHDLCHFYASGLIAEGCDAVTVQRAMRHSNATTKLGTYSHLWPSAEDRTRAAAEAILGASLANLADYPRTGEPKIPVDQASTEFLGTYTALAELRRRL
jgi:integrase